jgi:hypothetical protein
MVTIGSAATRKAQGALKGCAQPKEIGSDEGWTPAISQAGEHPAPGAQAPLAVASTRKKEIEQEGAAENELVSGGAPPDAVP